MAERKKVDYQIVRAGLFRRPPRDEETSTRLETFALQRWFVSNEGEYGWQLPGGRFYDDEAHDEAVARVVREETGLTGLSFTEVGEFVNGKWLAYLYVASVEPALTRAMTIDMVRNEAAKWFEVDGNGQVKQAEFNRAGQLINVNTYAFDNSKMAQAAFNKLRRT